MTDRMPYGYGSIYYREGDDRWIASVELPRATGAPRRRKSFSARTREAALAKLAAHREGYETLAPLRGGRRGRLADIRAQGGTRHTYKQWVALLRQHGPGCEYCGVRTVDAAVLGLAKAPAHRTRVKDHRVPIVRGGSDAIENIAVACQRCNSEKGTMTEDEYRAWKAA